MKFKVLAFFAILATLLFSGCDSKENTTEEKDANNQNEAQVIEKKIQTTFMLTTQDGKTIEAKKTEKGMVFKGYEDKVVLLNFFAIWCAPCKAEIPHLNNLRKKYTGKFEVIAVLLEENKQQVIVDEFITNYKINYPVTNTSENFALADLMDGVPVIPTMYMYGKGGELIEKFVGIVPEEMLESDIKKGLGI